MIKKSKLDEQVPVPPEKALENLDRMFDHVVSVSNKAVQERMKRAKKRRVAKRGTRRAG
jgi:hypothetical protein